MIHVEGYKEASEDDGVAGIGGNVTEHGGAMNGGAVMRDRAGNKDEWWSNHGNNPERRVDQEDFF